MTPKTEDDLIAAPVVADPIRRRAETPGSLLTGRGARTGWTICPLCPSQKKQAPKRYALGRGIATHLHAIHTPWLPPRKSKEHKKKKKVDNVIQHRDKRPRLEEEKDSVQVSEEASSEIGRDVTSWTPTAAEMAAWNAKVLEIVADLERTADDDDALRRPGLDRTGQVAISYQQSLPPFLQAAAQGDLQQLQSMMAQAGDNATHLLDARDRHGSIAEHWAAGGGHVDCLRYLRQCRRSRSAPRGRRRDGKTALHYAARHGQWHCLQYLLEEENVDVRSNDGTTPLHLACYGGHVSTVRYLIETGGADMAATNDFGCHGLHWIGMTLNKTETEITELLHYWMERQGRTAFLVRQKHGHTIVHKAAQKLNQSVIAFMGQHFTEKEERIALGGPDANGHTPSHIWRSFGGSDAFAQRMEQEWQW